MTNKVISSIMLAATVAFLALAQTEPSNILFLFLAQNPVISIARVLLAAGMFILSFKHLLGSRYVRAAAKNIGIGLMVFGALAMFITPLSSSVYNYLKLVDFMVIAEAGVIFTSCAVTAPQLKQVKKAYSKKTAKKTALVQRTA